jgi:hypothetical protein
VGVVEGHALGGELAGLGGGGFGLGHGWELRAGRGGRPTLGPFPRGGGEALFAAVGVGWGMISRAARLLPQPDEVARPACIR